MECLLLLVILTTVTSFISFPKEHIRTQRRWSSSTTTSVQPNIKTLPWQPEGYNSWAWEGNKINYVEYGDESNPPILLIHGFGASVFHWRYNIPDLSQNYHVFAIDLLGFGLSDKPVQTYSAEVWRDQALSFIENVIKPKNSQRAVIAGNSLGGFTALYATYFDIKEGKNLIKGCALLNAAGRFKSSEQDAKESPGWLKPIQAALQRFIIGISFVYTKQPTRIEQVLRQVYPCDDSNVDADLIESIRFPAQDPNAAEVFYRVIKKNDGPPVFVDDLVKELKSKDMPLALVWGQLDPWIKPKYADQIQQLYPDCLRFDIDAGHCPHDEAPGSVNEAIMEFMRTCNGDLADGTC